MDSIKSSGQVRIQLSTRNPELELATKPGPFLVPTNVNRESLSSLVNELLQPPNALRFDFLISGNFLRTDLSTYLTNNGISAETTLDVEYLHALTPPTHKASFAHDDWVGCVDVLSETSAAGSWSSTGVLSGHERIASGSHDGILRIWSMSGTVLAASQPSQSNKTPPHIFSTKFISPTSLVSAGNDMNIHLWAYTEDAAAPSTASLTPTMILVGHTGPVNSLAVHAPSQHILSASSDHTARLWSSSHDPSEHPSASKSSTDAATTKRRKLSSSSAAPTAGPLATLTAHTRPVHATLFLPHDPTAAYTASADRTLRTWDLTSGTAISSRSPAGPHTALQSACALGGLSLVAVGTAAGSIVLVDPREGAQKASAASLVGHQGMVNAVAAEAGNAYGLVSASNDGVCRVWDVRNSSGAGGGGEGVGGGRVVKATYKIPLESSEARRRAKMGPGESASVFDVVWDERVGIVCAGEDCVVQVNKGERGGM